MHTTLKIALQVQGINPRDFRTALAAQGITLTPQAIYHWVSGKSHVPSRHVTAVCHVLKIDPNTLFNWSTP